ncbi:MAG: hypothetical protein U1B77_03120 [Dehalococcoidales bacterium]|nr:hypothetical protein [Dehalococcoidales bacterium]
MVETISALSTGISQLAEQLFGDDTKGSLRFTSQLLAMCAKAQDKDFLLVHNPGGWGTTHLENLLQWERSIVSGAGATLDRLGYTYSLIQYFRTGSGWSERMGDIKEQYHFFASKAKVMAAGLSFITQYYTDIKVVLVGASLGAAFTNAVSQHVAGLERVFSIELGIPFPYKSRRVITKNTLVVDSNGLMPDALMEWNVPVIIKAYLVAPFRWTKYLLQGKRMKFTYCTNIPGHDYNWDYPEVQQQIETFLSLNFGNTSNLEVETP